MTPFQSACLVIFVILAYLMWVDENVVVYLTLIFKIIRLNSQRFLWMLRFHPIWIDNPIAKWKKEREYAKIIEELQKKANVSVSDRESN